jgi:hypothetical protein
MTVENPDVENSVDMIAVQWPGSGAFVCGAMPWFRTSMATGTTCW